MESGDASIIDCCLRETFEEISLASSEIEILGCMRSIPDRTGTLLVTPVVGWIRNPMFDPTKLKLNPDEVEACFTLPMTDLFHRRKWDYFRDSGIRIPYWKLSLKDNGTGSIEDHGPIRLWGLTAYFVNDLQKLLSDAKL